MLSLGQSHGDGLRRLTVSGWCHWLVRRYGQPRERLLLPHTGHLFPSYCDGETTKANSASAALNKWLKAHVSKDVVVHSLRHAMRDRLRAVECPADIIDQIGGWSRKGVGESYGRGYQVEQLWGWMARARGVALGPAAQTHNHLNRLQDTI